MSVRITTQNRAGREVYVDRAKRGHFKGKFVVNPSNSNRKEDGIGLDTLDEVADKVKTGRFLPRCRDDFDQSWSLVGGPFQFHT